MQVKSRNKFNHQKQIIMRKSFNFGVVFVLFLSLAILLISCHKDETNSNVNNGDDNGDVEEPSEGGEGTVIYYDHLISDAVTDVDGNSYDAVQLGNQVWMAENLRTTRYPDSTAIPLKTSTQYTTAARYVPGQYETNEENMGNIPFYGYLYNWFAVMHGESSSEANPSGVQGICPDGWHVPSDAEWAQLIDYLATQPRYMASGDSSHLAKALATTWGWQSSELADAIGNNPSVNNLTNFSSLPAGSYHSHARWFGQTAGYYTATESNVSDAYYHYLNYFDSGVRSGSYYKYVAMSVRCVRNKQWPEKF